MQLSKESLEEFKEIFKKEYGRDLTDEEAFEYAFNLVGFFKVLYDCEIRDLQRKDRLKTEPKGFPLESDSRYSCPICGLDTPGEKMWYDKHGQKCIICQKAIDKKIIPGWLCNDQDGFYKMWELEDWYKVKSPTVRKLVRDGRLKARIIPNEDGKPHCYIFIIKENSEVLKSKPKYKMVKIGENRYTTERPEFNEKLV